MATGAGVMSKMYFDMISRIRLKTFLTKDFYTMKVYPAWSTKYMLQPQFVNQ